MAKTNALLRIWKYIDTPTAKIYANAYILSAFSYCPIIWMFCNKTSNNLINKAHRRCLKCAYNKKEIPLANLLQIDGSVSIHTKNLRILMAEVFKSLKQTNPRFMWDMFQIKCSPYQLPLNLTLLPTSSKRFGTYSLVFRSSFIWNNLPAQIKNTTTLKQFTDLTQAWTGNVCNWKLCL